MDKSLLFTLCFLSAGFSLSACNASDGVRQSEGSSETTYEWIGEVDPYQTQGTIEIYGSLFNFRKQGGIRVSSNILIFEEDTAILNLTSVDLNAPGSTHVEIKLNCQSPDFAPDLRTGFVLEDGSTFEFSASLSAFDTSVVDDPLSIFPHNTPGTLKPFIEPGRTALPMEREGCGEYRGELPTDLRDALSDLKRESRVREWFVQINKPVLSIVSASSEDSVSVDLQAVRLVGQSDTKARAQSLNVRLIAPDIAGIVKARTDVGRVLNVAHGEEEGFQISGFNDGDIVSIWFEDETGFKTYGQRGRWFKATSGMDVVVLNDGRVNAIPEGKIIPPSNEQNPEILNRKYTFRGLGNGIPHTRYIFSGKPGKAGAPDILQEFDNSTFANQAGFFDRDRFVDNPDDCTRVLLSGGSNNTTLMHRLSDKATFLLEAELGVAWEKCVEVISVGQGSGHLASYVKRVMDYGLQFDPDYILFEVVPTSILRAHPELQVKLVNVCPDHPVYPYLYYNGAGELKWIERDRRHAEYSCESPGGKLVDGVPLYDSIFQPFETAPEMGKDALVLAFDTLDYMNEVAPNSEVIFISYAPARLALQYPDHKRRPGKRADGSVYEAGYEIYNDNLRSLCEAHEQKCIIFPVQNPRLEEAGVTLAWNSDNHHDYHGLQFFADYVASRMMELIDDSGG